MAVCVCVCVCVLSWDLSLIYKITDAAVCFTVVFSVSADTTMNSTEMRKVDVCVRETESCGRG